MIRRYIYEDIIRDTKVNFFFTNETRIELHGQVHSPNARYMTEEWKGVSAFFRAKHDLKIMVAGWFFAGGVSQLHCIPLGQPVPANYYH